LNLNFRVGLTEALSNAMLYGNNSDPEKSVRVEVAIKLEEVSVRVTDQGVGFDPTTVPDPTLPANISKSGGRGIFLMKAFMDEVQFNDRGNSVTLVLRFEGEATA
jgi:serine/threonine-protein kinase RsbW